MQMQIGSAAVLQHLGKDYHRIPRDYDFICTEEEALQCISRWNLCIKSASENKIVAFRSVERLHYEFNLMPEGSPYKLAYEIALPTTKNVYGNLVPSLEFLLALKMTHRFKDGVHFEKTRNDILYLLERGIKPMEDSRFAILEKQFTKNHPKLNVSAKDFFVDAYHVLSHDDLHQSIMSNGVSPSYKKIINGEVWCDMAKFDSLTFEEQIDLAVEESYVLAIERWILPKYGFESIPVLDSVTEEEIREAYKVAVRKVCTRITSGKFRLFCWENYDTIVSRFSYGLYWNFIRTLKAGEIRKFGEDF